MEWKSVSCGLLVVSKGKHVTLILLVFAKLFFFVFKFFAIDKCAMYSGGSCNNWGKFSSPLAFRQSHVGNKKITTTTTLVKRNKQT